jgi:hypothetical protein
MQGFILYSSVAIFIQLYCSLSKSLRLFTLCSNTVRWFKEDGNKNDTGKNISRPSIFVKITDGEKKQCEY